MDALGMHRVTAKLVPKLLLCEQKKLCLDVAQDMLECANSDPDFLMTMITDDECSVYRYDSETKAQSSQWNSPASLRPKEARQAMNKVKMMLNVFLTIMVLCIMSTLQKAKLLTNSVIKRFFVIFTMQFGTRDKNCGCHATGSCLTTLPQPILHT